MGCTYAKKEKKDDPRHRPTHILEKLAKSRT